MAEDSPSNVFRSVPISDQSSARAADASDGVRVLRLSRDAINGGFCGAFARDAPRVLYFLSLVIERPQHVLVRYLSLHVCLPRI